MTQPTTELAGPAWDLSGEYDGPASAGIENDLRRIEALLAEIESLNAGLAASPESPEAIEAAQHVYARSVALQELLGNVTVYADCLLSVDSRDEAAQALRGRLLGCQKRAAELLEPLAQFVSDATDEAIAAYLSAPAVRDAEFLVRHARRRRHERLPLAQERLIAALSQDGIHAWGRMYTQLSATMDCDVVIGGQTRRLGLAQAASLLQDPDEEVRRHAWRGINDAWERQEEVCAAALNAIAGWRLEVCRRRSHTRPVHFLDAPVHANRIARATLDALLAAAEAARPLARRTATALARASGRAQLGPWDLRAPAPAAGDARAIPFAEGLELIARAYGEVHPEMGEFVRMMGARRWIEATVGPRKRPGAYCTRFAKSRTPRVYMTYSGAPADVVTLAHELGHAFHAWVMRDLPAAQRSYGMSLAETASTFGEAAVRDALQRRARTDAERLAWAWEDIAEIQTFLLNIPVRFSFERAFYQRRAEAPLRPNELKRLMSEAWIEWYGDTMCAPDPMFWASKLHFFLSGLAFYNFPYLFGYLFSMNLYLRRDELDGDFHRRYVALLRDTGRMTAEELAEKHLGADLTQPGFWRDIVSRLEPRVAAFEALAGAGTEA
jgi:oligoendopeptidase F